VIRTSSAPLSPVGRALRGVSGVRRLRRHPLAYWLIAGTVAVATGSTVAGAMGAAEAERARLGGLRPALVAGADLAAGRRLTDGDLRVEDVPRALLPAEPADPGDAVGRVLADGVAAGQVLSRSDLAPRGTSPLAARLPSGRRAIAVPGGAGGLRLSPGDVVDVYATFPPEAAGGGEPTFAVAREAAVVDVTDDAVTVAVRQAEVPAVAFALAGGVVTLALVAG